MPFGKNMSASEACRPGSIQVFSLPTGVAGGGKPRPVLITSQPNEQGNVRGIPGSTQNQPWSESLVIQPDDLREGHLDRPTVFPISRQMAFPTRFFCGEVGALSPAKFEEILRRIIGNQVDQFESCIRQPKPFTPGSTPIPPSGKLIGAPEIRNLVDAALDGWLTTGRFNAEFERRLSGYLDVRRVLTTNSGSSANLLALAALTSPKLGDKALKPGDEVITVAAGFPTTVNPILLYGLVPVFVDVEIPTYNIDSALIEAAITGRTRAIMLAHTLGNPFDLDTVMRLARKHDLWVIEDCCDALGSIYTPNSAPHSPAVEERGSNPEQARKVGTFGDIGALSFYPAHHITMGEGGAVFTRNPRLAMILESLRDWGRDCFCEPGHDNSCGKRFGWQLGDLPAGYDHKYTYSHLGYNFKLTDMQAACGLAQMDRLEDFIAARKRNFAFLSERLAPLRDSLILPRATPGSDPSWFGFPITLRPERGIQRVDLLRYLDEYKVGARLLFAGNLTRQPYMRGQRYRISGYLKNTDLVMNQTFWIGLQPALSSEMLDYGCARLEAFLSQGSVR